MDLTKADLHIHTKYSFDSESEPRESVENALSLGLETVAFCDHCDIDGILDGIYPPYEQEKCLAELRSLRDEYAGRIDVRVGIELGQAHVRPDEARALLERGQYDFVLGSLHNLRAYPDFFFLKYEMMTREHINLLVRRAISEQCEIANFKWNGRYIDALTHITYIGRYLKKAGIEYDFLAYEKEWRELFHILIENGIALEVNTSGLRSGYTTMAHPDLIALYKDCGGERFIYGSDAHFAEDVGKGLTEAAEIVREASSRRDLPWLR